LYLIRQYLYLYLYLYYAVLDPSLVVTGRSPVVCLLVGSSNKWHWLPEPSSRLIDADWWRRLAAYRIPNPMRFAWAHSADEKTSECTDHSSCAGLPLFKQFVADTEERCLHVLNLLQNFWFIDGDQLRLSPYLEWSCNKNRTLISTRWSLINLV